MTVVEGLRIARQRLLDANAKRTESGYFVAAVDRQQADELRWAGIPLVKPSDFVLPPDVRKAIGTFEFVGVLFGDLVVARISR